MMEQQTNADALANIKGLNVAQYEKVKQQVGARLAETVREPVRKTDDDIAKAVGPKPTLDRFHREHVSGDGTMNTIALVIFAAAFIISTLHIVQFMGEVSAGTFADSLAGWGIPVPGWAWAVTHQVGMVLLAEASVIFFMVMHSITNRRQRRAGHPPSRITIFLMLALCAAGFVVTANLSHVHWELSLQVAVHTFIALLVPAVTLGLGYHIERLVVDQMSRAHDLNKRYTAALEQWEVDREETADRFDGQFQADYAQWEAMQRGEFEKHPDYRREMRKAIWDALTRLKVNAEYADAPRAVKLAACAREMQRDSWADADLSPEGLSALLANPTHPVPDIHQNGHGQPAAVN